MNYYCADKIVFKNFKVLL